MSSAPAPLADLQFQFFDKRSDGRIFLTHFDESLARRSHVARDDGIIDSEYHADGIVVERTAQESRESGLDDFQMLQLY